MNTSAVKKRVSVLIRTMGRASLSEAIESVAAQTFHSWDILVINASGAPLPPFSEQQSSLIARLIEPGERLERGAAANMLLDAAHSDFAVFLDDDDLFLPMHLEKLVDALDAHPQWPACYSDVEISSTTAQGLQEVPHCFEQDFDPILLQVQNFLPIHSVLFRLEVVRTAPQGRFDEALTLFEDWDFWLQLAQKGALHRVPGVSALYRMDAQLGSGHATLNGALRESMLSRLGDRQLQRWNGHTVAELIAWEGLRSEALRHADQQSTSLSLQLDQARVAIVDLNSQSRALQAAAELNAQLAQSYQQESTRLKVALVEREEAAKQLQKQLSASRAESFSQQMELEKLGRVRLDHLQQIADLNAALLATYQSTSWRLTKPVRGLRKASLWLLSSAPNDLLRNTTRAVLGEARRHGWLGFWRRLPHYLRNRKTYGAVLQSTPPLVEPSRFMATPTPRPEIRLHPDLGVVASSIDTKVSIVIPTLNAGDEFQLLLRKLKSQRGLRDLEIVIVDSGSTDNTVSWAQSAGCQVIEIPSTAFTHSYARNLGASHASGEYLIFMVQDAYPTGDHWAYGMVRFLLDHKEKGLVAASCSEYSRSDSDMMYDAMIKVHYQFLGCDQHDRIGSHTGNDHMALRSQGQLSDVACLISREVFGKYGYQGNYAEDLDLGIRLIKDGHRVAMLASVKVIHSHNRPAFYYLKRSYVDVIFLVGMFEDFLCPVTESLAGLLAGICSCAQHVSNTIEHLQMAPGSASMGEVLAIWISTCQKRCHDIVACEKSQLGDDKLDRFMMESAEQVAAPPLDATATGEARRFADMFFARLVHFHSVTESSYATLDRELIVELKGVIVKTLAASAGSALGFMFMDKERRSIEPDEMTRLIDQTLRAGV